MATSKASKGTPVPARKNRASRTPAVTPTRTKGHQPTVPAHVVTNPAPNRGTPRPWANQQPPTDYEYGMSPFQDVLMGTAVVRNFGVWPELPDDGSGLEVEFGLRLVAVEECLLDTPIVTIELMGHVLNSGMAGSAFQDFLEGMLKADDPDVPLNGNEGRDHYAREFAARLFRAGFLAAKFSSGAKPAICWISSTRPSG